MPRYKVTWHERVECSGTVVADSKHEAGWKWAEGLVPTENEEWVDMLSDRYDIKVEEVAP